LGAALLKRGLIHPATPVRGTRGPY
jgi:hypothetical protein